MDISDLLILFTRFKYSLCPLTHSNLTISETNWVPLQKLQN